MRHVYFRFGRNLSVLFRNYVQVAMYTYFRAILGSLVIGKFPALTLFQRCSNNPYIRISHHLLYMEHFYHLLLNVPSSVGRTLVDSIDGEWNNRKLLQGYENSPKDSYIYIYIHVCVYIYIIYSSFFSKFWSYVLQFFCRSDWEDEIGVNQFFHVIYH